MPRISEVLERESRTIDLEQGDFERLLGRRERKQRNARIRAGAVGIIVALAMGIVFIKSLRLEGIPADQPVEHRPAPAASGSLAYQLDGDIYVADPDGTNAVMIADGSDLGDDCPGGDGYGLSSWSPDGRYLALRCSAGVVITDPQGGVVATFPAQGRGRIAWSPDSTRVAVWDEYFWAEPVTGPYVIGIYGIDGTRETQIAMPPGWEPGAERDPVWTPDGASLIVNELEVPLDGGTPRELPFPWFEVAYSPDGSQVAYVTRWLTRIALMVARPDGSEPREVLFGPAEMAWSPTGELIAVTADAPGGPGVATQLSVVDPATGSATLLFESERRTVIGVIGFSPEGDRVLFDSTEHGGAGPVSLWSVGVDGSDARLVVAGTGDGEWLSR
ncbi:MAG TPA: hypothetical protein VJN50_02890 [Actinomycetota bacterium]|nr:hypothetical protein [Actinomycetota bacterium]